MSAITPDWYNDFGMTSYIIKVTFLKHLALEVWVSILIWMRLVVFHKKENNDFCVFLTASRNEHIFYKFLFDIRTRTGE